MFDKCKIQKLFSKILSDLIWYPGGDNPTTELKKLRSKISTE